MILSIDTSCYTTSMALAEEGRLIAHKRKLLPVRQGECGLRQSEALFCHMKQLPEVYAALAELHRNKLTGICVSAAPRAVENSYMPVFNAGLTVAEMLTVQTDVPLYKTTHQEGHLAAALYGIENFPAEFLALHLSGGTTELLKVKRLEGAFESEILGTADLAAGQMIDRIGVACGLGFPAGRELEKLALANKNIVLPVAVKNCDLSFSGPETVAERLLEAGAMPEELAYAVFVCIAESLIKAIKNAVKLTGLKNVLIAGGVALNIYIREMLKAEKAFSVCFASRELSSDNAVGVALLGEEQERKEKNGFTGILQSEN